jgi:hypothetical protein
LPRSVIGRWLQAAFVEVIFLVVVFDLLPLREVNRVFADVRGEVGDPLQIPAHQ